MYVDRDPMLAFVRRWIGDKHRCTFVVFINPSYCGVIYYGIQKDSIGLFDEFK